MKDKKCKCGHMESNHDKVLGVPTLCINCNCTDFTKDAFNVRTVKIMLILLGIVFTVSSVGTLGDITLELIDTDTAVKEMMEENAYELLYDIMLLRIIIVVLYGFFILWIVKTSLTSWRRVNHNES